MSLFRCSKCNTIENTATSGYWWRDGEPPLCSGCDPEFGKYWHGRWKRQKYNPIFWKTEPSGYVSKRWYSWSMIKFNLAKYNRKIWYKIQKR